MISTVCLNPSFDKTAYVENLISGEVNRLTDIRLDMGGKGLNVAVAVHRFGMEAQCLCIIGDKGSTQMNELIQAERLTTHFLPVEGAVRTNLKVVSRSDGRVTEFNEPGAYVSQEAFAAFRKLVKKHTASERYLVLTGSLPPGLNEDAYCQLMKDAKGVPCVVDSMGAQLLLSLSEQPYIVKPNLGEIESTLKRELKTLRDIRDAGISLVERGAKNVVISMGKAGALMTNGPKAIYAPALKVAAKSTVGAGDAMVGGLLYGLEKFGSMADAFRCGIAAGAASVMTEGTQLIRFSDFEMLLPQVKIQEV